MLSERDARCPNGHSFDRAKEGYFNLMHSGRIPSSTTAGDTAESLQARRSFLNSNAYAPVVSALTSMLGPVNGPVLDVGCGEGFYLSHIEAPEKYGLDISKKAIQMASRAYPDTQFVVGTSFHLPVQDHSCSAVFTVFAPHSINEYERVLRPGGKWVTVSPGPHHLEEMRPRKDEKIREREQRRTEPPAGCSVSERVQFTLTLTDSTARDLYTMTPLQFQASSAEAVETVRSVSVDVWISSHTLTTTV